MYKGRSERDVTWVNNQSLFKTILSIFKRDTCLNINGSQASKDQSMVCLEFIIKGLTDVIDLNPANWDACVLGSLRMWTEEQLTTTPKQPIDHWYQDCWAVEKVIEVEDDDEPDITPPPTMSESSMFLQRVRDLALSMKDQTLLESIIRSQELLLRAKVTKSLKGAQSTMDWFLFKSTVM